MFSFFFFKKSVTIDIIKNYSAGCYGKLFPANPIHLQRFQLLNGSLEVEDKLYIEESAWVAFLR